jgi:hypothetical protein
VARLAAAKMEAENSTRMRLRRMNKSSNVGDEGGLIRAQCVQNLMHRSNAKSSYRFKHIKANLVPASEQKAFPKRTSRPIVGAGEPVSAGLAKG